MANQKQLSVTAGEAVDRGRQLPRHRTGLRPGLAGPGGSRTQPITATQLFPDSGQYLVPLPPGCDGSEITSRAGIQQRPDHPVPVRWPLDPSGQDRVQLRPAQPQLPG